MCFCLAISKSVLASGKLSDELPYKVGGENAECEEHRIAKLVRDKRSGAEHRASEIGEKYLHCADEQHYEHEGAVFRNSRKEPQAVCSAIEAVEERREDK